MSRMHYRYQCTTVVAAVLSALPVILGNIGIRNGRWDCITTRGRAETSEVLLQVTKWNFAHSSVLDYPPLGRLPFSVTNVSPVSSHSFEMQSGNASSVSWVVAASGVLPAEDVSLFGEGRPTKVVDPPDAAPRIKLRHSTAWNGHFVSRLWPVVMFGSIALLVFFSVKTLQVVFRSKLQEKLEHGERIYVEYRTKSGGKWHKAEYILSEDTADIMMRRCSDGKIVTLKQMRDVRKAKPPPRLPPPVAKPKPRSKPGLTEQVSNLVSQGMQPQHVGAVTGVTGAMAGASVITAESESDEESSEEEEAEEDRDLGEQLAEGASYALYELHENVQRHRPKKLLKKGFKKFKKGIKKGIKEVAAEVEEAQDAFEDAVISARLALDDPAAAMMSGLGALQEKDLGQVASEAVGAVASGASAAKGAVGAVSGAAASAVGKAAKQMKGAHQKHFHTFKENLAKATAKQKENLREAHAETLGTISSVVSDARNVAETTSKTVKTLKAEEREAPANSPHVDQ